VYHCALTLLATQSTFKLCQQQCLTACHLHTHTHTQTNINIHINFSTHTHTGKHYSNVSRSYKIFFLAFLAPRTFSLSFLLLGSRLAPFPPTLLPCIPAPLCHLFLTLCCSLYPIPNPQLCPLTVYFRYRRNC